MPPSSPKLQKGGAKEKKKEIPALDTPSSSPSSSSSASLSSPSRSRRARDDASMSPVTKKRKNSTSSSPTLEEMVPDTSSFPLSAKKQKGKSPKEDSQSKTTTKGNPENARQKKKRDETKEEEEDEKRKRKKKAATEHHSEESSLSPLLSEWEGVVVEEGEEDLLEADASGERAAGRSSSSLLSLLQRSKVIAPDCSGIRAVAVHPDETNFVVARENGSFMRIEVEYFQNMPHFTVVRHTGGCRRRTVTSMHYWKRSERYEAVQGREGEGTGNTSTAALPFWTVEADVLIVTYLSGQIVLYDSRTLFPIHVHQRTGGALWGSSWVPSSLADGRLWTAVGDGSWQQWRLSSVEAVGQTGSGGDSGSSSSSGAKYGRRVQFELEHVIPRVVGSQRALSVHAHPTSSFVVGTDDGGQVVGCRFLPPSSALPRKGATTRSSLDDREMERSKEVDFAGRKRCRRGRDAESVDGHTMRTQGEVEAALASSLRGGGGRREGGEESKGRVEVLWTSRLPKGIGLCCCVCMGGDVGVPVVAVGSTSGDVVLLDLLHDGLIHAIFSHHRGPVSSIVSSVAEKEMALYATGWHEALRCYRCDTHHTFSSTSATSANAWQSVTAPAVHGRTEDRLSSSSTVVGGSNPGGGLTAWSPAEVKRRTHYHEAMQLVVLPQRHLLLSASRDGTVLYAGLQNLFTAPANYLPLTTQQFAFCRARNMLFSTRYGRIEVFQPDTAGRHWRPVFAYASHGRYHLSGLWCDPHARTLVYSTDERVVVLRVSWTRARPYRPSTAEVVVEEDSREDNEEGIEGRREGEMGEVIRRIEEHVQLPANKGLQDVLFYDMVSSPSPALVDEGEKTDDGTSQDHQKSSAKREKKGDKEKRSSPSFSSSRLREGNRQMVYLLFDDGILTLPSTTDKEAIQPVFTPFPSHATPLSSSSPVSETREESPTTPLTTSSSPSKHQSKKEWNEDEKSGLRGSGGDRSVGTPVRKLFWHPPFTTFSSSSSFRVLVVSGPAGSWMMAVSAVDGNIIASTLQFYRQKQFHLPHTLPMIGVPSSLSIPPTTRKWSDAARAEGGSIAALSLVENRYVCGSSLFSETEVEKMLKNTSMHSLPSSSSCPSDSPMQYLPSTLPHDTVFVAQVHPASFPLFSTYFPALAAPSSSVSSASPSSHEATSDVLLIGCFRRGVLLSTTTQWKMIYRGNVEAAFVLPGSVNGKGDSQNDFHHRWTAESEATKRAPQQPSPPHKGEEDILQGKLLILERNLEKALESMPLTWKVRRFGN